MDFLHHKMFESTFFCSYCIPLNLCGLLFDFVTIQIIKMCLTRSQFCKFKIIDIVNVSRIFQNCWNIRSHISLSISNANNHRTIFTCHPNFSRIITEHQFKCIRATNTYHRLSNGINRPNVVLFVVIIN